MSGAREIFAGLVFIGLVAGGQLGAPTHDSRVLLWGASVATASQRTHPGARQEWAFGQFDPEKFLEQFFGQDTQARKEKLAAIEISRQEEQQFGEGALQSFQAELRRQRIRVLSRGPEVEYLQSLVAKLRPQMRHAARYRTITVLLADTPETDARCFPGGTLLIFRGMMAAAQSEAAVVAILGHELSHIDHGHQLRTVKSLKLAQQTFASGPGMDFQAMMDNTMFVAQSFARPFRPEEETEADEDGVTWAYRLGYDPAEFAKLFLRMERRDADRGPNARQNRLPAFLRTHPYHRDRYDAVLARLEELRRTEPQAKLYVGQENLLRLVPRSKREYAE